MYLRTTKRRNADGSEVRYFQLAVNVWDAAKGCSVAKVIYSFGRGDDVDAEKMRRLALGYKQWMRVEECWRTLKSGLRIRPVYHFRPRRIQAHVGISMLALLLKRIVEIRVKDTWRNVRATLQTIKIVEYDRGGARIRQTSNVREDAAALLRKLKVPLPPKVHEVAQSTPVEGVSAW